VKETRRKDHVPWTGPFAYAKARAWEHQCAISKKHHPEVGEVSVL
jgi:hypothetical protein